MKKGLLFIIISLLFLPYSPLCIATDVLYKDKIDNYYLQFCAEKITDFTNSLVSRIPRSSTSTLAECSGDKYKYCPFWIAESIVEDHISQGTPPPFTMHFISREPKANGPEGPLHSACGDDERKISLKQEEERTQALEKKPTTEEGRKIKWYPPQPKFNKSQPVTTHYFWAAWIGEPIDDSRTRNYCHDCHKQDIRINYQVCYRYFAPAISP